MNTEIDPDDFDAAVFDLEGVPTNFTRIHALVQKQVFGRVLSRHRSRNVKVDKDFDIGTDYLRYVDGRPRLESIRAFLSSRRPMPSEGGASAAETLDTIAGIGRMKNRPSPESVEKRRKGRTGSE